MLHAADFELQTIQAVVFAYAEDVRPRTVLQEIIRIYSDIYDGAVTSLPLPDGVPAEFPAVTVASSDGTLRIDISRSRIVTTWTRQGQAAVDLLAVLQTFGERLEWLRAAAQITCNRLGCVVTRQVPTAQPGRVLAAQFCREEWLRGPLNRPEGFEIHAHKVFNLSADLHVNSWMRITTAKANNTEYQFINVQQDINTLAEEIDEHQFFGEGITDFARESGAQFEQILALYFPTEG